MKDTSWIAVAIIFFALMVAVANHHIVTFHTP